MLARRDILKFAVMTEIDNKLLQCGFDEDKIAIVGSDTSQDNLWTTTKVCTTCERVYLPMQGRDHEALTICLTEGCFSSERSVMKREIASSLREMRLGSED